MRILIVATLAVGLAACGLVPERAQGDPRLDRLFAELATAPNPEAAQMVEQRLAAQLANSGSATVDVLMDRAAKAEAAGRNEIARALLDEAVRLEPDFAEAYSRRASVAFAEDDLEGALDDLDATLDREPRHFAALLGVAAIYEQLGREDAALEAYRQALTIHPFLEPAKQGVARLSPKVDGEDI